MLKWTLKPVAFTAGLLARLWARKFASQHGQTKAPRRTRREEKQRRKELRRATATAGRRRAA